MKKILMAGLLAFLLMGCSSIPKQASFYVEPESVEPFVYELRDVQVSIDYVQETEIAEQFYNLLLTQMSIQDFSAGETDKVIYVDVNVNQRSFIQDIQQKNSIYITFTGYDEEDNIVLRENSYIVGKGTFISSVEQFNCGKKAAAKLLNFQKGVNKAYLKNNEE